MKYPSLKSTLVILLVSLITFSCTKENTGPSTPASEDGPYYVRFKADGVQKEYKTAYLATFDSMTTVGSNKLYIYGFGASKYSGSHFETLQLGIYTERYIGISNINYSFFDMYKVFGVHPQALLIYMPDANTSYFTAHATGVTAPADSFITFTELTDSTGTGVFQGSVYHTTASGKVSITDGRFFVPIKTK